MVMAIRIKFVFIFKFDEANTLGMIKNIEKGLSIPPVRKSKMLN